MAANFLGWNDHNVVLHHLSNNPVIIWENGEKINFKKESRWVYPSIGEKIQGHPGFVWRGGLTVCAFVLICVG